MRTSYVIGGGREGEHPPDLQQPAMPRLPQHADRLQPAEHFLNPFSFPLADPVSFVSRRPPINRAPATPLVMLRDVRSGVHPAHLFDEISGVVPLVPRHRDP